METPRSDGPRPPSLPRRLIRWRHQGPTADALLADLAERHSDIARVRGRRAARLWYWRQSLMALFAPLPGTLGLRSEMVPNAIGRDVRQALLRLRRRPLAALAAVLPLGIGIGIVTTSFSIVWGTVLAGLPFEEADRLVHFERSRPADGQRSLAVTPHDYVAWQEAQQSFEDLGAYVEAELAFPVETGPPERHDGIAITANSFRLLRVEAALGRTLTADDMSTGAPEVLLLSDKLWRSRYGSDPSVVGRELVANGRSMTVIGVMPAGFGFPVAEAFWLPLRIDLTQQIRGSGRLDVFGRLRPEASLESAREEFDVITGRLESAWPDTNLGISASLRTFHDEYVGEEFTATVLRLLLGAVLVLLVCCANVANLLLVRGMDRRRDLAVRRALGATRHALVRQLLGEAILISALASSLGVLLASVGVAWFNRVGTGPGVFPLPHGSDSLFWWDVSLNPPTLLATAGVTALTAALAGLMPALSVSGDSRLSRRGTGGGGEGRIQRAMVIGQIGLTTGLLVAAGFVGRSGLRVSDTEGRLVTDGAIVMRLSLPSSSADDGRYGSIDGQLRFLDALRQRIEESPAARSASVATAVPLQTPRSVDIRVQGPEEGRAAEVGIVTIGAGYFDVFDVQPLEGRVFGGGDGPATQPVVIVNQSFADRYLSGRTPIGEQLRIESAEGTEPWLRIVGVVPDLWERPGSPEREAGVYVPVAQIGDGDARMRAGPWGLLYPTVVAAEATPGSLDAAGLGQHVYRLDPSLPVRSVDTMGAIAERSLGRYRIWARFWSVFAGVALALASLGIFGVFSYIVAQRTSEIGVRRALGASTGDVRKIVLKRAVTDAAVGTVIGLVAGRQLVAGLRQLLYDVTPNDPAVPIAVALVVVLAVGLASWIPAQRAARIDPRVAMQAE